MTNMYMVRAGSGSIHIDEFKDDNVVFINFGIEDLSDLNSLSEVKRLVQERFPKESKYRNANSAGTLWRFKNDLKINDYVISYDSNERKYSVGIIKSDYYADPNHSSGTHLRDVQWIGKVDRDDLKVSTKNSLGSLLAVFKIDSSIKNEIMNLLEGNRNIDIEENEEEEVILKEEIIDKSNEFIKDRINELGWDELQDLVAGLLRAMGYRTIVSPKGPDLGKDIIASPDGLGLENPKIRVEVKHRNSPMGASDLRSFIGGLPSAVNGLYVSTGGFTKDAKYEAERSEKPLTIMDLDKLVYFITQYYDNFDVEAQTLLPLTKIYWPH